jgi:hypothetical protein
LHETGSKLLTWKPRDALTMCNVPSANTRSPTDVVGVCGQVRHLDDPAHSLEHTIGANGLRVNGVEFGRAGSSCSGGASYGAIERPRRDTGELMHGILAARNERRSPLGTMDACPGRWTGVGVGPPQWT